MAIDPARPLAERAGRSLGRAAAVRRAVMVDERLQGAQVGWRKGQVLRRRSAAVSRSLAHRGDRRTEGLGDSPWQ